MKSNDLEQIIFEAESWIGRLKALRVKHEAPTVRGVPFDYASLPTFEQATGYTAVDMTTAAAQGFRDAREGLRDRILEALRDDDTIREPGRIADLVMKAIEDEQ